MAHRALYRGPAAGKQSVNQRAQRTYRIDARTPRFSGNIHLDGTNLTYIRGKIEVTINTPHRAAQMRIQSRKRHARHMHRANLRQEYLPRTVNPHVGLEVHLAPGADA